MKYDNALDEWVNKPGPKCILPSECISGMRDRECSETRKERHQRMIDHGDVDPDYFNR